MTVSHRHTPEPDPQGHKPKLIQRPSHQSTTFPICEISSRSFKAKNTSPLKMQNKKTTFILHKPHKSAESRFTRWRLSKQPSDFRRDSRRDAHFKASACSVREDLCRVSRRTFVYPAAVYCCYKAPGTRPRSVLEYFPPSEFKSSVIMIIESLYCTSALSVLHVQK